MNRYESVFMKRYENDYDVSMDVAKIEGYYEYLKEIPSWRAYNEEGHWPPRVELLIKKIVEAKDANEEDELMREIEGLLEMRCENWVSFNEGWHYDQEEIEEEFSKIVKMVEKRYRLTEKDWILKDEKTKKEKERLVRLLYNSRWIRDQERILGDVEGFYVEMAEAAVKKNKATTYEADGKTDVVFNFPEEDKNKCTLSYIIMKQKKDGKI